MLIKKLFFLFLYILIPSYGIAQYTNNFGIPYPYQNMLGLGSPYPALPSQMPMQPYGPYLYPQFNPQYIPQNYPLQVPLNGSGGLYSMGYPGSSNLGQLYPGMGTQNGLYGNTYDHIKTEIIDVDPDYHKQQLGLQTSGDDNQMSRSNKSRFKVKVDSQSQNVTSIPANLTKPIITEKSYTTTIRRSIIYDSSKPTKIEPINIHYINGVEVTTVPPTTTTESDNVAVTEPFRFMDPPKSCSDGYVMDHKENCIMPFVLSTNHTNDE